MTGLEPAGESFDPPDGLDPVREAEEHLADGWPHEIEVRIDASFDESRRGVSLGRLEPIAAGTCRRAEALKTRAGTPRSSPTCRRRSP